LAFPDSIVKESRVSLSSLCHWSCNHCVHTICPNTPISKYSSTDVSILLMFSLLRTVHWISKSIFPYLTKHSSLCLNGSAHAIYCLTNTIVLTYLVLCTHVQSAVLQLTTAIAAICTIAVLKYNDAGAESGVSEDAIGHGGKSRH
jgi:hypothetical protein